jgi:hypothetical protein
MATGNSINTRDSAELLSYILNFDPALREEIDLPVQGESIIPIGKIILSNQRYKNAFLNTINLIALTVISKNDFNDPWEAFTEKGVINFGQSVREIAVDIADVYDYNEYVNNATHFLENVVPNVYQYIHELNFQKFYKTTTSDEQIAMAFSREQGLYDLIEEVINSLYRAYKYDKFLVNKYMLARRIVDGTMTPSNINNWNDLTPRERVAKMKNVSNLMTFMSPNYNPAGLRRATAFEDQYLIMNSQMEADMSTEVLATSFFLNQAEMKTNMALVDKFTMEDEARLKELLGEQYIPFTEDEKNLLGVIPAVLISRNWYKNYTYTLDNASDMSLAGTRASSFYNPETLRTNHWLHVWKVFSTSPFEQGTFFIANPTADGHPTVESVTVSPATATVLKGQNLQLTAVVETRLGANKSVKWELDDEVKEAGAKISQTGLLTIPANFEEGITPIGVYAISVYQDDVVGEASITIA